MVNVQKFQFSNMLQVSIPVYNFYSEILATVTLVPELTRVWQLLLPTG
jgi:hypothetical protein